MPRRAKELTALDVRRLEHPGTGGNKTFTVGGVDGLQLQITPTGAKSWILRCTVGGRRRNLGLGSYPTASLAQAREAAREAHEMIRRGIDPIEERKAAQAALRAAQVRGITFKEAMERFAATKEQEFKSARHGKIWRSSLDHHAIPVLGDIQVADIERSDILRTLEPIWTTKTETAKRLRQRLEAILGWAEVAGHREGENPARWKHNLDAFLPAASKIAKAAHHPALRLDDAADWFADVRSRDGTATRAVELMAVTAARSGEIRGMTWAEVDLDSGLWTIPADRMKAQREHRVPLTAEAVDLLRGLQRVEGSPYVFPAARGGMLSDAALSACMRRVNEAREGGYLDRVSDRPAVPHGLRSTFRDWAAERTEFPRDMAEIALAHNVGSEVERAYRRGDMVEKRRAMMRAWQAFLTGRTGAKVVAIKST